MIEMHQLAAALYLGAGIAAWLGVALPAPQLGRVAVGVLGLGALIHAPAFAFLHNAEPPIPITDLPAAVSLMSLLAVLFYLALLLRVRLTGLLVLVAPAAFLGVFFAALRLSDPGDPSFAGAGSWPHAHVVLASAGFAFLGVAGLAGLLFLTENRRLKTKKFLSLPLPSLEALDRVNLAALALGFPLLTLGVLTGVLWVQTESGRPWTGSAHELWNALGWALYAGLATARFAGHQGSRSAAAASVGAALFLLFAVVGVGVLA
ncbi:MAG: cytochrome c biogenesis protein CcsA [Deltaproteobacteria bacterium]|nr:MAG: cytochrome c biogenesis protein CcsA [Deltaproteobacteria bacterium]